MANEIIKAILAGTLALIMPVGIAHAQSDFDRARDRKSMTDDLYAAYRHYGYVKMCHEGRSFWTTYVSDADFDRARDKILIVETDTLAWLNDTWNKDQNVDTESLFGKAMDSLYGATIDKENCRSELLQLFQTKSSAGKVIKKDF
jgi:hypothetical protein